MDTLFGFCFHFSEQETCSQLKLASRYVFSVMFREMGLWKHFKKIKNKKRLTALHQRTIETLS